jgi:tetratricopeptide (TPR) repeat protein
LQIHGAVDNSSNVTGAAKRGTTAPCTLNELLTREPAEINGYSIALINLLSASGLPECQAIDIPASLARLRLWAKRVHSETVRHMYRFKKSPYAFRNSEGYFRMLVMGTVLCEDFNIHYDPELERDPHRSNKPLNGLDLFLSGLLSDARSGTCSSMPVLYLAIGEILGYPVKLVRSPRHFFVRWEGGPTDTINVEATENRGLSTKTDEGYIRWAESYDRPISPRDIANGFYLRSLSKSEAMGAFLMNRGACSFENGNELEAIRSYSAVVSLNHVDLESARSMRAIEIQLTKNKPLDRHPRALNLEGTNELGRSLDPRDAACLYNGLGHYYEILGWIDLAWSIYSDAVSLDPTNLRYRENLSRIRGSVNPTIKSGSAPASITIGTGGDEPTAGDVVSSDLVPMGLLGTSSICMGMVAESAGDFAMAQAHYVRAMLTGVPPDEPPPFTLILDAVQRELRDRKPSPSQDPRDELPPLGKGFIFAARGLALEARARFAEARDNFALALFLQQDNKNYAEMLVRVDIAEQVQRYRRDNGGSSPPPGWQPRRVGTVSVQPHGPIVMGRWIQSVGTEPALQLDEQ